MQELAEHIAGREDGSLMALPGADRLTFDGRIALAFVTPHLQRSLSFPSLAGASVQVAVPEGWTVHSVSASVRFERRGMPAGFQRHPRGSALTHLLPEADQVHPDSLVSMHGGLLAHYLLDWGPEASAGFTLWQGSRSDVFSAAYETFEQAVDGFSRFVPRDTEAGAVLDPPAGWSVKEDRVTVDCGDVAVDMQRRDESTVPSWPGAAGLDAELYRLEDGDGVLAVSRSAAGTVTRTPRHGHAPMTDAEVMELARGLRLGWIDSVAGSPYARIAL